MEFTHEMKRPEESRQLVENSFWRRGNLGNSNDKGGWTSDIIL